MTIVNELLKASRRVAHHLCENCEILNDKSAAAGPHFFFYVR